MPIDWRGPAWTLVERLFANEKPAISTLRQLPDCWASSKAMPQAVAEPPCTLSCSIGAAASTRTARVQLWKWLRAAKIERSAPALISMPLRLKLKAQPVIPCIVPSMARPV